MCYVRTVENRGWGDGGICDLAARGSPVKIQLHVCSYKLLLSCLEILWSVNITNKLNTVATRLCNVFLNSWSDNTQQHCGCSDSAVKQYLIVCKLCIHIFSLYLCQCESQCLVRLTTHISPKQQTKRKNTKPTFKHDSKVRDLVSPWRHKLTMSKKVSVFPEVLYSFSFWRATFNSPKSFINFGINKYRFMGRGWGCSKVNRALRSR